MYQVVHFFCLNIWIIEILLLPLFEYYKLIIMKDRLNFYQVFKFGGFIGVTRSSLSDVVMVNIFTLITMIAISGIFATLLPILLSFLYILMLLGDSDSDAAQNDKFYTSLFTIIATIYFLLDYHFGWLSWIVLTSMVESEIYQYIAAINLTLGLLHLVLLFYYKVIFPLYKNSLNVLKYILLIVFLLFNITPKMNTIVGRLISQYVDITI